MVRAGPPSPPGPLATSSAVGAGDPRLAVDAMLAVGRAMASQRPLPEILDTIAERATSTAEGAFAATIMLIGSAGEPWRIAGAHGLSAGYRTLVHEWQASPERGRTLAEQSLAPGRPVIVDDTESDHRFAPWRDISRGESFRGFLALPLATEGTWLGALNVFRTDPGAWTPAQVELLSFFAEHAAIAIHTRALVDRQVREMAGLRRLVRSLQDQAHERANRLHTASGLLAIDAVDDAREFLLELADAHHEQTAAVLHRVAHPVLAGLLLAESSIAEQRSITLEIDPSTDVERIPVALGDAQVITIVGNLLDNAFDAVSELPAERRTVTVGIVSTTASMVVTVSDRGVGLPRSGEDIFGRGVSTKDEHRGVGLSLVRDAVHAARGVIEVRRLTGGTSFRVEVPFA